MPTMILHLSGLNSAPSIEVSFSRVGKCSYRRALFLSVAGVTSDTS